MRNDERSIDNGPIVQHYLHLGEILKHELERIFVLKLVVDINLILQYLLRIITEEWASEFTIFLDLLFPL